MNSTAKQTPALARCLFPLGCFCCPDVSACQHRASNHFIPVTGTRFLMIQNPYINSTSWFFSFLLPGANSSVVADFMPTLSWNISSELDKGKKAEKTPNHLKSDLKISIFLDLTKSANKGGQRYLRETSFASGSFDI